MLVSDDRDLLLLDVTPLSLGIMTFDGHFATLIPRNTTAPVQNRTSSPPRATTRRRSRSACCRARAKRAAENHLLGEFVLSDIPPAPKGQPEIEVPFDIDANGS